MLTAIRKFFGVVAVIWLGWVALDAVVFVLYLAIGIFEGSHTNPEARSTIQLAATVVGQMFLISLFTAPLGVPSCLVWFGIRMVQVSGHRRPEPRLSRRAHHRAHHYLDFGRWFELRDGQPVFTHGKHAGRLLWEVARRDSEYLAWVLGEELPQDTRRIVADALEREARPVERSPLVRRDDTAPAPAIAPVQSSPPPSPEVFTYEAPGVHLCPTCGLRPALFYCRPHRSALCLNCVGLHDSPAECLYVPAWRTEAAFSGMPQPADAVYSYEARGVARCPKCQSRPAVFYCRAHSLSLCLNCVGSHDVSSECYYVPGWRAGGDAPDATNAPDGGPGKTHPRRKTGDIFGIS